MTSIDWLYNTIRGAIFWRPWGLRDSGLKLFLLGQSEALLQLGAFVVVSLLSLKAHTPRQTL